VPVRVTFITRPRPPWWRSASLPLGAGIVAAMEPRWPRRISSHEVIPVALDTWWPSKVHLAERAQPGQDTAPAAHTRWSKSSDLSAPPWRTVTLCGRPRAEIVPDADDVDLLSSQEQWMCSSCWRIVEGWLTAPPPIEGEDAVVRWVVNAVLGVGEALLEGVPVPRLEAIRRRIRREIKATIGGSVQTSRIGPAALWVRSGLVQDAKTPERWQEEMRAGVQGVEDMKAGRPVERPRWRGHWREITEPAE